MTLSRYSFKQRFYAIAFSCLLTGCNVTRTEIKNPEFAKDNATISSELHGMISCEGINISGSKSTTNDKIVTSQLTVEFVNPTNADDNQNELGKRVAEQLKQDLKDPNSFDSYKVTFAKKTEHTGMYRNYIYTKDKL